MDNFLDWDIGEKDEEFQQRYNTVETLLELDANAQSSEDSEGNPASSQIKALIKQLSFKANITILGDPGFGTYLEPARGYFISDFSGLGRFSGYLSGLPWIFLKATHKFGNDGTYKTDLELISEPVAGGDTDTGDEGSNLVGGSMTSKEAEYEARQEGKGLSGAFQSPG